MEEFEDEYFIITEIVENNILGNNPTKKGVHLYFKVNGTTQILTITYSLFSDILSDLGSYYSIMDLVGQILAFFYSEYFVRANLINSVFSFNEHETRRTLEQNNDNREFDDNSSSGSNEENKKDKKNKKDEIQPELILVSKDNAQQEVELNLMGQNYTQKQVTEVGMGKNGDNQDCENNILHLNINTNFNLQTIAQNPSNDILAENENKDFMPGQREQDLKIGYFAKKDNDDKKINTDQGTEENNLISELLPRISTNMSMKLPKDIKRKYKILLNSLAFDEDKNLENNILNRYYVSPYELMFECCYRRFSPKTKAKYELIKKCTNLIEKTMNIEHIIKKNFELSFLKQYLLSKTEVNMFKYHFKTLNLCNYDDSMSHLRLLRTEGIEPLTKDQLIAHSMQENDKMFEIFFDYHLNL